MSADYDTEDRSVLVRMFEMVQAVQRDVGHQAGVLEQVSGQIKTIGHTLHQHMQDEAGIVEKVDALSEISVERHKTLEKRLEKLDETSNSTKMKVSVILAVGAGIGTLITTIASAALTGNADHIARIVGIGQ